MSPYDKHNLCVECRSHISEPHSTDCPWSDNSVVHFDRNKPSLADRNTPSLAILLGMVSVGRSLLWGDPPSDDYVRGMADLIANHQQLSADARDAVTDLLICLDEHVLQRTITLVKRIEASSPTAS